MRDIKLQDRVNSICLICGRIKYNKREDKCSKCGGLVYHRTDADLAFMGRSGIVEVDKDMRGYTREKSAL
jgi:ligand-binding sensor protein